MAYPLKWSCRAQKECQRCCCTTPNEVFLSKIARTLLYVQSYTQAGQRSLCVLCGLVWLNNDCVQEILLTWYYYYCPVPINDNFDWHLQNRSIHPSDDDDEGALIGHRSIAISSSLQEDQCYLANDLQCHYRASIQRRESFNNIISCSSGPNIKVQHRDRESIRIRVQTSCALVQFIAQTPWNWTNWHFRQRLEWRVDSVCGLLYIWSIELAIGNMVDGVWGARNMWTLLLSPLGRQHNIPCVWFLLLRNILINVLLTAHLPVTKDYQVAVQSRPKHGDDTAERKWDSFERGIEDELARRRVTRN